MVDSFAWDRNREALLMRHWELNNMHVHLMKYHSQEQGSRVEFIFDKFPYIDGWDLIVKIIDEKYGLKIGEKIDGIWIVWRIIGYKGTDIKLIWHEDCGNFMYCEDTSEYAEACLIEFASLVEKELNAFLDSNSIADISE